MCDPYVVTRHNYGRDTLRSKRPMSCLEAGHILPNGLEKTIFIFLLSQHLDQIWNTEINWIFAILQRRLVYTAPGLKFKSATNTPISQSSISSSSLLPPVSVYSSNLIANICRRRTLLKAYKPIRFCRLRRLIGNWRKVANKTSTSLIANKIVWRFFRAWKFK